MSTQRTTHANRNALAHVPPDTAARAKCDVATVSVYGSARQPEPPTLVLNEPGCYHFRVLDPRLPLRSSDRSLAGNVAIFLAGTA